MTQTLRQHSLMALIFAILVALFLEHSRVDVVISQWFYLGQGQWMIAKSDVWLHRLFYTMPKRLLICLELYLIFAWLYQYCHQKSKFSKFFQPVSIFSKQELNYLVIAMLAVPTIVASLKGITHTPCPASLLIFDGSYPYLPFWQNIQQGFPSKCFPAAHASSGFALYAWCFVPSLFRYRWLIMVMVTILAWLMGGYKMAIGDHFFSHTLVSMLLAWAICAGVAWKFFGHHLKS